MSNDLKALSSMVSATMERNRACPYVVARTRAKLLYTFRRYLVSGRKFDLRIYALVTSFHPLKVWLAREGFARLSTELYDLEDIDNSRVHLTNMAIQLKITDDDKKEELKKGCKWALNKIREYLTARHGVEAVEALFQRIAGQLVSISDLSPMSQIG